jgi:phosphoribosyl-ATP pyrophosphohydrolase
VGCTFGFWPILAASDERVQVMSEHPFDRLYNQVSARRSADPARSYTAKLLNEGVAKCAKKVGEEGVEVGIAALVGDQRERIAESADLLYHLCVLWVAAGIDPADVYAELTAREGRSGLDDKAARKGIVR